MKAVTVSYKEQNDGTYHKKQCCTQAAVEGNSPKTAQNSRKIL